MVLGILTAIAACPAIIGTTEAIRQGQRSNAKEAHRGRKSNLIVSCLTPSRSSGEVNGGSVVLWKGKLYIAVHKLDGNAKPFGHPFAGYFLPYPDHAWGKKGEGLVSTISDEPPQLNWIYVDETTGEVRYGNRAESEDHLVGPWDCTKIDKRLTLEGWEGFMAVRSPLGVWQLYFDQEDNGLRDKVSKRRMLEVQLTRRELKKGKEIEDA